jgi:alkanesulfonate monooxygenase SsuD/methylene tetrahydromethanopterin reductase-like flavin-dependent oxidoreductase (luciferase family)
MSLRFHWFLPTNGDGRDIVGGGHGVATGTAGTIRPATLAYLAQVARSAEQLGFEAALTPTGIWCEDAWLRPAGQGSGRLDHPRGQDAGRTRPEVLRAQPGGKGDPAAARHGPA